MWKLPDGIDNSEKISDNWQFAQPLSKRTHSKASNQAAKSLAEAEGTVYQKADSDFVSGSDGLQYSYSVRTVLISLYSLSDIGGGERYTLNTIRSIQAGGDECTAYAVVIPCSYQPYHLRLATKFVRVVAKEPHEFHEVVTLKDLVIEIARYDAVVIHQYLSSDIIFELVANCASDQVVLFTNLGHEPLSQDFETCFQPSSPYACSTPVKRTAARTPPGPPTS